MVYIGYPVTFQEAYRLFKPQLLINGFNEEKESDLTLEILNDYLSGFTTLRVHWIDKGVCILGYDLKNINSRYWSPLLVAEDAAIAILRAKREFTNAIRQANINISVVTFEYMEWGEEIVYNPEPALFF